MTQPGRWPCQPSSSLEAAYRNPELPNLAEFVPVPPDDPRHLEFLALLIGVDRECRRKRNVHKELAAYLAEWPELQGHTDLLEDPDAALLDRLDPGGVDKTAAYVPREQRGTVIAGRYKLLEEIGEGGMGRVWVAEQTQPVRRKVALKLIKAGMDSKSVLARFEAERQALAMMDHPNIAKVLDGGLTETGRPFFVMDYVKGIPITEYCETARLSIPERLQLFVEVCQAVQHAHQKGIIHRDLKPSNILVAPYDDTPVPKVIDFGLAKAIHQPLTERTLYTAHGMVLGTPLYMSPEQTQLNNLDIDTRSDLYSLGVLLYELLTGTTPLEKQRFKEAAWDEVRRIIREEEPPRPSMRLSSSQTLPSLAAGRQLEPAELTKMVRGELDWITMKALEKDRTRRYETANSFALDVQRYLAGEPVLAVPPSARYRLQKFIRKHRAALAATAAIILLLLVGAAVSTWQAVRATRAEADKSRLLDVAVLERQRADTSAEEAQVEKQRADANAEKAQVEKQRAEANAADARRKTKEAEEQKNRADTSASEAQRKTKEAEDEKKRAERELLHARTAQYSMQIGLAQRELLKRDFADVEDLLNGCAADLRGWEYRYLWTNIRKRRILVLHGHKMGVNSVAFSPDGRQIVSGSGDNTVNVWDIATGKEILTLKGHAERVDSVAFSPDGKRIVSGGFDRMVKVWDIATGKETLTITVQGRTNGVSSVAFSPDGKRIASGSWKTVNVWDAVTGKETLRENFGDVSSVAFSADGKRIISGGGSNTVKVWDAVTGNETLTLKGHTNNVTSVAFSADGKQIVSGSWDETLKLWDAATGKETLTLKGHTAAVSSVAFSPDGKRIISGSGDGFLNVWDAATGQETLTLKAHTGGVNSVAFSPDGRRVVSGSSDDTVKVWDVAAHQETLTLAGRWKLSSVAFSPDSQRIVSGSGDMFAPPLDSGSNDTTVKVWDAATGQETLTLTLKGHTQQVRSVALSADGKQIASASADKTVKLWNAATGKEMLTLKGHEDAVDTVSFSPDGKQIASGSADKTVRVWNAATGKETLALKGHEDAVVSVSFSPDGERIVSGSRGGTLKVWNTATGKETLTIEGPGESVSGAAFSPDGRWIASWNNWVVSVWDAATGKEMFTLKGHTGSVLSVAFSPDGKRIASGGADKTLKLWDPATGKETLTLKGHTDGVSSVAFSRDGKQIVSGSADNTLKVWDAATGSPTLSFRGHTGTRVCNVAFSPDGRRIISASGEKTANPKEGSGSSDTTIKVWDAATGAETRALTFRGHTDGVSSVAFSADENQVASESGDETVRVWNVATGQETLKLMGHNEQAGSTYEHRQGGIHLAFSPDGRQIVSGSCWDGGRLNVWDSATGHEILAFKGDAPVYSVAFSSDGRLIASAGTTVTIWDVATRQEVLALEGHTGGVSCLAFSPDGKRIVSGSGDKTLNLWDLATGEETLTLKGHTDGVSSVAFSPDGKRIISGSNDHTVKVWDAEAGVETLTLTFTVTGNTLLERVSRVAFSPDGRRIVLGCESGTVKVWDAGTGQETPLVEPIVPRKTRAARPPSRCESLGFERWFSFEFGVLGYQARGYQGPAVVDRRNLRLSRRRRGGSTQPG